MRAPVLRRVKKIPTLRASLDFSSHGVSFPFTKYDPIKGIKAVKPLPSIRSLRPRSQIGCQASLSSFSYPELSSKPRWWWRTLAFLPYLLPLHSMWAHADGIYQLHPYLPQFELFYAFIDTKELVPGWHFLVINQTIYHFVARRKWLPHFLRHHIMLALLLDAACHAFGIMCTWSPSIVFQGKPMAYFWMTVAYFQVFKVVECMRCALAGMYANVPFVSDTAFIHSDVNL